MTTMTIPSIAASQDELPDDPARPYAGSAGEVPLDVGLDSPAGSIVSQEEIERSCELVVLDTDGQQIGRIQIRLTARVRDQRGFAVTGQDQSRSLHLRLAMGHDETRLSFRLRFRPAQNATPRMLIPALTFLELLRSRRWIGLWLPDIGAWGTEPAPVPSEWLGLPDGYANAVHDLARIQHGARNEFPMPPELTSDDRREIRRAVTLLDGGAVRGTWPPTPIRMAANHAELLDETTPATIEFKARVACIIAGKELDIGNGDWRFHNVLIEQTEPVDGTDDVMVTLAPGGDDTNGIQFDVTLAVSGHQRNHPQSDVLAHYAGQWIVQSGSTVVASHRDRDELVRSARESGVTGTLWRVPRSRQEAEKTPLGF